MDYVELTVGGIIGVATIEIERFGEMINVGDFREFKAQVIVFGGTEAGVNATHLVVNPATDQPEVERHEFDQQAVWAIGNAAKSA